MTVKFAVTFEIAPTPSPDGAPEVEGPPLLTTDLAKSSPSGGRHAWRQLAWPWSEDHDPNGESTE